MNIAIIPARGGSKRVPRKNIKHFHGKPIIIYPIETALKSGLFDQVVVTTDDNEIAEIAQEHGGKVPFKRPAKLADDHATTIQVVQHAIETLGITDLTTVCCIYPTAVFITPATLKQAFDYLSLNQADFVMPVTTYSCPIERALKINKNGHLTMRNLAHLNLRTQDCEKLFHDVGQFYFGTSQAWQHPDLFYTQRVKPILVPKYRALDIDTIEDWELAELIFSKFNNLQ